MDGMRRPITLVLAGLLFSAVPASAQRLPGDVRPDRYDLAFAVDLPNARFEGTETIQVRIAAATSRIVLHAVDLTFHDVTIGDGVAAQKATITLDIEQQTATLSVPRPLAAGTTSVHT